MKSRDTSTNRRNFAGLLSATGSFMRSAIGIALFVFFFSSFALFGSADDQRDEAVEQRKEIVLETLAQFMEQKKLQWLAPKANEGDVIPDVSSELCPILNIEDMRNFGTEKIGEFSVEYRFQRIGMVFPDNSHHLIITKKLYGPIGQVLFIELR